MKRIYKNLPDTLTEAAHAEVACCPELKSCSVVYFPQIGYLVAVPVANLDASRDAPAGSGLQFQVRERQRTVPVKAGPLTST
jgi:hypothetical protein